MIVPCGVRSLARPSGAKLHIRCAAGVVTRRSLNVRRVVAMNNFERRVIEGESSTQIFQEGKQLALDEPLLFTLTTNRPDTLTESKFFYHLKGAVKLQRRPIGDVPEAERTVVVLATPSFAGWLEDKRFVGKTLAAISKKLRDVKRIKTVLAVVDGLAPPASTEGAVLRASAEGFSFMVSAGPLSPQHTPDMEDIRAVNAAPASGHGLHFNFLRKSRKRGQPRALTEVTVPLANTIFRNGRPSTLMVGQWTASADKEAPRMFTLDHSHYKDSWTVKAESFRLRGQEQFTFPVSPLTEPKRIVAGLGNIIRQLEGDDGAVLPASTELEERVVSFLKMNNIPQQKVSVWALVVPENKMEGDKFPAAGRTFSLIHAKEAGLYRILSGGGGWGTKAGLLSLDPVTTAPGSESDDDLSSFQKRFGDVDEQTRALGDVAKPGSFVQFLIAHEGLVGENGEAVKDLKNVISQTTSTDSRNSYPYFNTEDRLKILFGCIRSTIDDIPTVTSEEEVVHLADRKFSAQTELGLFVQVKDHVLGDNGDASWVVSNASKIDVPGTKLEAWYEPAYRKLTPMQPQEALPSEPRAGTEPNAGPRSTSEQRARNTE